MSDEKKKALEEALKLVEKEFGKGIVRKLDDKTSGEVDIVSTGIINLDWALGGGLPKGRIIELFGPESSGKSSLCLAFIAEMQKKGGTVLYIDSEHAFDPKWAKTLGANPEQIYVSQPDSCEDALNVAEKFISSQAIDLVIFDSVASMVPKAEVEGDFGASTMGLQARLMSQALRKLTSIAAKSKTIVIFINQLRQKIGVMWGSPDTTPGGLALKFYSSVRMDIRKIGSLKDGDTIIGSRVRIKIIKNKVASPFKEAEFDFLFGKGIYKAGILLDVGVEKGVIEKDGNTYSFNKEKLGVGRGKAVEVIESNVELYNKIYMVLSEKLLGGGETISK